ncbi:PhzF family phenazine biosynthesis protein [Liquorilactobacillus satsumensis]|uniref:PhzF family phenazine biosynthesis protein n=1 Tax=Liquorilactobacillus TaxID=2767888 RepID=UPI0021C4C467|nr:PhzF family phenazine biosynthesis protein [Liquorilactobacillus satsumensis]MCP9313750.1 PhzF family phenazine biosynthesis protein [Liquorilactobacillus satsumensis]MCP9360891.1 PhzF family phenazine biosynthesis protein [Liquorilactobacillus satsumensis]
MKMYVVDAFTDKLFKGNPAAVCFVEKWPTDKLMQNIAMENKFSETAFAIKKTDDNYDLRWFTPGGEIDLCGHATLATGYLVFQTAAPKNSETVTFNTQSGALKVTKKGDLYEMSFPSYGLKPVPVTDEMATAFGVRPVEAYLGRDLLAVFPNEDQVKKMQPDLEKLKHLDGLLQNVTAPGKTYDCVSRSFAPKLNVDEDPVCGSGHCHIIPYWAKKLDKNKITAFQASARTGVLYCDYQGKVTKLGGHATLYSTSQLNL